MGAVASVFETGSTLTSQPKAFFENLPIHLYQLTTPVVISNLVFATGSDARDNTLYNAIANLSLLAGSVALRKSGFSKAISEFTGIPPAFSLYTVGNTIGLSTLILHLAKPDESAISSGAIGEGGKVVSGLLGAIYGEVGTASASYNGLIKVLKKYGYTDCVNQIEAAPEPYMYFWNANNRVQKLYDCVAPDIATKVKLYQSQGYIYEPVLDNYLLTRDDIMIGADTLELGEIDTFTIQPDKKKLPQIVTTTYKYPTLPGMSLYATMKERKAVVMYLVDKKIDMATNLLNAIKVEETQRKTMGAVNETRTDFLRKLLIQFKSHDPPDIGSGQGQTIYDDREIPWTKYTITAGPTNTKLPPTGLSDSQYLYLATLIVDNKLDEYRKVVKSLEDEINAKTPDF